jgi:hypothetical protein
MPRKSQARVISVLSPLGSSSFFSVSKRGPPGVHLRAATRCDSRTRPSGRGRPGALFQPLTLDRARERRACDLDDSATRALIPSKCGCFYFNGCAASPQRGPASSARAVALRPLICTPHMRPRMEVVPLVLIAHALWGLMSSTHANTCAHTCTHTRTRTTQPPPPFCLDEGPPLTHRPSNPQSRSAGRRAEPRTTLQQRRPAAYERMQAARVRHPLGRPSCVILAPGLYMQQQSRCSAAPGAGGNDRRPSGRRGAWAARCACRGAARARRGCVRRRSARGGHACAGPSHLAQTFRSTSPSSCSCWGRTSLQMRMAGRF